MNTNKNTDQLFGHMRRMPVEVPLENVEKFVIAQAAVGITAVGASKGIFTKAFFKFHLNSILIMTTTITAALVSFFVWTSDGDKISAQHNSNPAPENEYHALQPSTETFETDSPKVKTVNTFTDGEKISVTTVQTETGTNIKIISLGDGQTSVYYNTPTDSSYTFAYASPHDSVFPAFPAFPPFPDLNALTPLPPMTPTTPIPCLGMLDAMDPMDPMPPCTYMTGFQSCNDTLMTKLEQVLLKDGLIADTLHYTFKINGSYLKVNGVKQSKEQWKKYKEVIESNSRNKVNRSFSYAISRDGEDTAINVENFVD